MSSRHLSINRDGTWAGRQRAPGMGIASTREKPSSVEDNEVELENVPS
jgi:hypothetical protein